jgi:hypothetical protein
MCPRARFYSEFAARAVEEFNAVICTECFRKKKTRLEPSISTLTPNLLENQIEVLLFSRTPAQRRRKKTLRNV